MTDYLESVLEERDASDLCDTRCQIHSWFDTIYCYIMTHPGFKVTKNNHSRTISQVGDTFLNFQQSVLSYFIFQSFEITHL